MIHQKLARSAREVLTDYAIGTKSAQPGLMGGGGGRCGEQIQPHKLMQSQSEIHNLISWSLVLLERKELRDSFEFERYHQYTPIKSLSCTYQYLQEPN